MAPEIETLSYLGHTLNTSNSSVEWEGTLGPGFYTFLVGGSDASSVNLDNHGLRVNFTAAPVPLPAAVWLFGSGMAGLAAWARRRMTTSTPLILNSWCVTDMGLASESIEPYPLMLTLQITFCYHPHIFFTISGAMSSASQ
ncbi:MAG: VPLPA-CTERM sorting domain-containing protein [Nitrospira sp.]|nr:VPLPA-CTERM sorting domain-containing protein [Nitrospira sp.]